MPRTLADVAAMADQLGEADRRRLQQRLTLPIGDPPSTLQADDEAVRHFLEVVEQVAASPSSITEQVSLDRETGARWMRASTRF